MFSIIIPLYNKEYSIKDTINSVLSQDFDDFEIVIVNDGSTDNSSKVVERIVDSRIRLIHQKNQGVSAARNRGIKEAKYSWVAFIDGDDLWTTGHLSEILKMMTIFPDAKVYTTSFRYSDGLYTYKHSRENSIFRIGNYFKEALSEALICTGTVVVDKSCLKTIGSFNEKLNRGEDLELWTRLAKNYSIIKSNKETLVYRLEAENRTGLSKDIERTHVYYINLDSINDVDEMTYYKKSIIRRMFSYLKALDFKNFYILRKRHTRIKSKEVLIYFIKLSKKKTIDNFLTK